MHINEISLIEIKEKKGNERCGSVGVGIIKQAVQIGTFTVD